MGSYSLNGTCFYNGQAITIHIKGQVGDPTLPPKPFTCTERKWIMNDLDLSNLSDGNMTVKVIHPNPSGKEYTDQKEVIKNSEVAAVSINKVIF